MPGVWFALKKLPLCKSKSSDVHEDFSGIVQPIQNRTPKRSASIGCLGNFKYVINRSMSHKKKPSICSSKDEEVRADNPSPVARNGLVVSDLRLSLGTTCRQMVGGFEGHGHRILNYELGRSKNCGGSTLSVCQICGVQHRRWTTVESHLLSKHAVSELVEGDSSRKIVEIICRTAQKDTVNNKCAEIETILKVNNMQNMLVWFEDYREMVKTKARAQSNHKENPRCLVDGNELLRFYATTVLCSLGTNGSSSLCQSINCGACRILRNGFFTRMDFLGRVGIFATSNSERALRYASDREEEQFKRKALFVCRVIAGKIHGPVRQLDRGFSASSRFDSLAWKVGRNKNAEELFLLNPRALLPCFVVIYKI